MSAAPATSATPAKLLWQPKDTAKLNLTKFARHIGLDDDGGSFDYATLHRHSIENPNIFWAQVWDYFSLQGQLGKERLSHTPGTAFCEASWFADTKTNYAENILNLNPRGADTSISFVGEDGSRIALSHEELSRQVRQCSAALRACGITKGDVVVGCLSNSPYAIIAMLAATRIGAIWSSCSPDFGVEAIIDRFGQIKPSLLFAQETYSYKGKAFDMRATSQKIADSIGSIKRIVTTPFLDTAGDWDDFLALGSATADAKHPDATAPAKHSDATAPAKHSDEPAKHPDGPAKHSDEPAKHPDATADATTAKHSDEPAKHPDGPANHSDAAAPADADTKHSDEPAKHSDATADAPAKHSDEPAELDFNHPLFIMFSSGTTGKPKCIVHSHGGVLLKHTTELFLHTDLGPQDKLFYFTTCGWMMWNWMVSGLLCGAQLVLYDGNPAYPTPDRLLKIFSDEGVTVAGISAKLIEGLSNAKVTAKKHDLSKLRMICSTGSPLSINGFEYVYKELKDDLCLASISGGTDILGCFVMGVPSLPIFAGEIQGPALGMDTRVYNEQGQAVRGEKGELVCCRPFPSVPVKFWGDDANKSKLRAAYFDKFKGVWTHGDYALHTDEGAGGFIIYGRSDNTLNPGGVRIGTAEIYRQVEKLDYVVDSLAVGQEWGDDGDIRIVLFVVMDEGKQLDDDIRAEIKQTLRQNASPRHVPAKIIQVPDLPRTISGKISEEAVRCAIHNRQIKNISALANPDCLQAFSDSAELQSD